MINIRTIVLLFCCWHPADILFSQEVSLAGKAEQDTSVTAETVLNRYTDLIGGQKRLVTVMDKTQRGTISVGGMIISFRTIQKFPDKVISEIKLNNNLLNRTVMNGEKALTTGMNGDDEVVGLALDMLKLQAIIFPEFRLQDFGYFPVLAGIEKFNGRDNYMIRIHTPSGEYITEYFDKETGYRTRTLAMVERAEGKVLQETVYLEYFFMDGIRYATKLKQTTGKHSMDILVDFITINTNPSDDLFR